MQQLTPEQMETIVRFAAKFPVPTTNDEASRAWTRRLCEQLAYSFPAAGFGHKRASEDRPPSADCVAMPGAAFVGWDVIADSGSPAARLSLNAESQHDLAAPLRQVFIKVDPVDYLGDAPPPTPGPTPVDPPPAACACEATLDAILVELTAQRASIERTSADLVAAVKGGIKIRF